MHMQQQELDFFLGALSPTGFSSYYTQVVKDAETQTSALLKAGPGCGKSTLLRRIAALARHLAADAQLGAAGGADAERAAAEFHGTGRRFEIKGECNGAPVVDDYAHHPTELTAVLTSAMKMGYRQGGGGFQPHTYSRTYNLLEDFAQALSIPDHLVMTEILAVREENKWGIHTSDLAAKVPGSVWFDSFEKIADYVMEMAQPGDLILTLGGGDIYKCANLIVEKYKARQL